MTLLPAVEELRPQTAALRAANAAVVRVGGGSTRKGDCHHRGRVPPARPLGRSGRGPRFLPSVREYGRPSGRGPEPGESATTRVTIHAATAPVGGAR